MHFDGNASKLIAAMAREADRKAALERLATCFGYAKLSERELFSRGQCRTGALLTSGSGDIALKWRFLLAVPALAVRRASARARLIVRGQHRHEEPTTEMAVASEDDRPREGMVEAKLGIANQPDSGNAPWRPRNDGRFRQAEPAAFERQIHCQSPLRIVSLRMARYLVRRDIAPGSCRRERRMRVAVDEHTSKCQLPSAAGTQVAKIRERIVED